MTVFELDEGTGKEEPEISPPDSDRAHPGDVLVQQGGYTLILVLVAGAILSLLAVTLIEYDRWKSQLDDVNTDHSQLIRAFHLGERQIQHELRATLEDTGYITHPHRREWSLPPDIQLTAETRSLNRKLNLNHLNEPGQTQKYRTLVENILTRFGYPRRAVDEIIRWIEPADDLDPRAPARYGGYGYRAPHRNLKHLDELALISGFRQRGIDPALRSIFTVHGSGSININHVRPELWEFLRSSFPDQLPSIPATALRSRESLSTYLTQQDQWENLTERFPFLTRRDDSFRIHYHASMGSSSLHQVGIYRYQSGDTGFQTVTTHEQVQPRSNALPFDELP